MGEAAVSEFLRIGNRVLNLAHVADIDLFGLAKRAYDTAPESCVVVTLAIAESTEYQSQPREYNFWGGEAEIIRHRFGVH